MQKLLMAMQEEYAMVASLLSLYERNRVTGNGSSSLFIQQLQHGQQDQKVLTIHDSSNVASKHFRRKT